MKLSLLNISFFFICIILIFIFLPDIVYAFQPPPPPVKPSQTPIDGGLAILGAAGGMYAVKKLRDRKK